MGYRCDHGYRDGNGCDICEAPQRIEELESDRAKLVEALRKIAKPSQSGKIVDVDIYAKEVTFGEFEEVYDERAEMAKDALKEVGEEL